MKIDQHTIILGERNLLDEWEEYWIKYSLRPFEFKMLACKRCRQDILAKAERVKKDARRLLNELDVSDPNDQVYLFTVNSGVEGMASGGFAKVRNGEIIMWKGTWLS
ncbi:MAG: hypothetical protein WBB01_17955 [Phormidesmis sp.]